MAVALSEGGLQDWHVISSHIRNDTASGAVNPCIGCTEWLPRKCSLVMKKPDRDHRFVGRDAGVRQSHGLPAAGCCREALRLHSKQAVSTRRAIMKGQYRALPLHNSLSRGQRQGLKSLDALDRENSRCAGGSVHKIQALRPDYSIIEKTNHSGESRCRPCRSRTAASQRCQAILALPIFCCQLF